MNTYLTIMVTILVITQIIRLIQNALLLLRRNKAIEKELDGLDVTNEDLAMQRKAYRLIVEALEKENEEESMERYEIKAKRKDSNEPWTGWAKVNDYDRALHHVARIEALGYEAMIIDREVTNERN